MTTQAGYVQGVRPSLIGLVMSAAAPTSACPRTRQVTLLQADIIGVLPIGSPW